MKLFIPEIGTRIQLTKDWTFSLFHERRNFPFFKGELPGELEKAIEVNRKNFEQLKAEKNNNEKQANEIAYKIVQEIGLTHKYPTLQDFWRGRDMKELHLFRESSLYKQYVLFNNKVTNVNIYAGMEDYYFRKSNGSKYIHTLPKGTILEVDRIYIRQGNKECSSLTFKIRRKKVLRFWAKLQDVNNIECKILEEKQEREQYTMGGGANYFHG